MTEHDHERVVRRIWRGLAVVPVVVLIGISVTPPACPAESAPPPPPPFYPDKMELLVWRDAQGAAHPVQDQRAWEQRRHHILANMQLVMGPLPQRDRDMPLDVQVLETEKLAKVTRQKILYTAGPGDRRDGRG